MHPSRFYTEKRNFKRLTMNCPVSYQVNSSPNKKMGTCVNLSAGGMLLECDDNYSAGTKINISVSPNHSTASPAFSAVMTVVRVISDRKSYRLGGSLEIVN